MEYKSFTTEQLDRAKNADIIEFLKSYMGFDFKKAGQYYQCKQHDSLVIFPDRKGFVWNSRSISGGDAIDFLRKVMGKTFFDAVKAIIGERAAVTPHLPPPKKADEKLVLPQKADGKYSRVFAYLSKTRGISPDVISDFMRSKQLYQDTKGNCVFVGYDENAIAKFGSVRGTLTEKKYRGDCRNSDKRYAFNQIGENQTKLYIFEAPIDLLSHCTMTDQAYGRDSYKKQTRLALCGSSDVALESFLERHKDVKVLHFRLDNDEAGKAAVKTYKEKYESMGYEVHTVLPKNKDVNEDLINGNNRPKPRR